VGHPGRGEAGDREEARPAGAREALTESREGELTVRIKYLSAVRDTTGKRVDELALPQGSKLRDVAGWLQQTYGVEVPGPRLLSTLNGRGWSQLPDLLDTELHEGDELALFPLVSGG
jgi:molybdopterin converting factor small subunit